MEGGVEGITDCLEDTSALGLDGMAEQLVVPGEGHAHLFRVLLPALGAALNIGKEKCKRADRRVGRVVAHRMVRQGLQVKCASYTIIAIIALATNVSTACGHVTRITTN